MSNSSKQLNVLLSAYACEPGKGSEPGVGWNIARELSENVNLWVITRANNRNIIEASEEAWTKNTNWIFWDPPHWLCCWKKGSRGVQIFYILWQLGVRSIARNIIEKHSIDIIHHLTFGKYWIPSSLASLNVPFVFGPVGGGEKTPSILAQSLSLRARAQEWIKTAAIKVITCLPSCRMFYRKPAWVFATTQQTRDEMVKLGVSNISILHQSGIDPELIPEFKATDSITEKHNDKLIAITASRLIAWKAVDLAIAAAHLASTKIPIELLILQDGPERLRLQKLSSQLGMNDKVRFLGKLNSHALVQQKIAEADVMIHPALHEAFGQACLESLSLGTPLICLDWAGPGLIVDDKCAIAVKPATRDATINDIADALIKIHLEKQSGFSRSRACQLRARQHFQWKHITSEILKVYQRVRSTSSEFSQ